MDTVQGHRKRSMAVSLPGLSLSQVRGSWLKCVFAQMSVRCVMQAHEDQPLHRQRFTTRYLDPVDRLAEVVYGVLVVLTFTLAYRGIEARYGTPEGITTAVQRMLLAAIGCTIAWGLIDGVMYILTSMFERSQNQRLLV